MKNSFVLSICCVLIFASNSLFAQCPADEADLANGGTFSGTCNVNVGGDVTITGNVTITSGTLTISGNNGDMNLSATFTVQNGASVVFDNFDGDVDVLSGGSLVVEAGGTFQAADDIQVQSGGSMTVSGNLGADSFIDIDAGATATVNAGGTMTPGVDLDVQGTLNISGDVVVGDDLEISTATGSVTIFSGGTMTTNDEARVSGGATLDIQFGATLNVGGDFENEPPGSGTPSQGTFIVNGTVNVSGNVIITNTTPDSDLTGTGTLDVTGTFTDGEGGAFSGCVGFPCTSLEIQSAPAVVNSTSPFNVTFEWRYNVTDFTIGDIVVGNGSASNFVATDGDTYTADITPDGNGDITIDVGDNEVPEGNVAATTVTVLYDIAAPTITFSNVPPVATATAFTITIVFNEDVTGLIVGEVDVTNGTKGTFTAVNATTYTQVITATGAGNVGVSINASVASDVAGNLNTASSALSIPYIAAISPGNIAGETLWLTADRGVTLNGTTVSDWDDQSGGGNDATQGTAASQPEFLDDDLNGNPSLRFDGTNDVIEGTAGFYTIEYFVVTVPSEIYNSGTSSGSIVGFETGDFARLGLGPTSGQITNEVVTHSAGSGASYRGAFTSTTADLNLPAIINVRGNAAADGAEIFLNGIDVLNAEANAGTYQVYTDTDYDIGDEIEGIPRFPFNGTVSEVISYSTRLVDASRRDVASYLAIKYGVTLDITAQNYTSGGTAIYNATTYPNDIAGIGIQLNSNLNHITSKSENAGSIVRMETASDLEDGEFLVWGNNGSANTFTTSNVPPGVIEMLDKVWTLKETGGDGAGTVTVSFDITSLGLDVANSTINLITMASTGTVPADFATASTLNSTGTVSNVDGRDLITFTGVDFADGDFFTLGGDIQTTSPGGSNSLSMWFRADEGITSSGGLVSSWADQSGNSNDIVQGAAADQPTLVSSAINFNDAVQFTGGDNLETIDGFYTEEYFLVVKPDNAITNAATNGYVLGFESQRSGGFFIGDENFIGGDLFGQTTEIDGYDVSAITPTSISNDNVVVFNVRNNADASPTAQEMFANGTAYTETTAGTHADFTDNAFRIGDNFDDDRSYSGQVAEVLSYSTRLTTALRRDVETYLGIKYGVTLDIDGGEFYTADGTDIYSYTAHDFDIAGLGKRLDYGLNQTQSTSQNTGAIVKMESLSDLDDNEYLMWGYDGVTAGSKTVPDANEKPALFDERLPAEWRVAVTGSPGTVTVKVYVGGITDLSDRPQTASLYSLLLDDNDDFSTITSSVAASSLSNDTLTFTGVGFTNGDRFTVALPSPPDVTGVTLWLKADTEVEEGGANAAEDTDPVQFWRDQSGNNNDLSQTTLAVRPTYNTNQLNGNPVITFDDGDTYLDLATTNLNPRSIFVVYNDASTDANTTAFTNDDNDDGLGIGYGGTTNLFDGTNTPADVRNGDNFVDGTDVGDGTTQARPANYELHSRVFVSNLSDASWTYYVGNDRGNTGTSIGGGVAEILVYTSSLAATARRDVETYLAIKYGITLDVTALNYTYNSGTAVYDLTSYSNDIAGIGSNSTYAFTQSSGTSNNSDAIITVTNPSSLASGDFLVWGNDNGVTGETITTVPPGIGNRVTRIWGVDETNDIGTVTVSFDLTSLGYGTKSVTDFTLIVDGNADFSDGLLRTYTAQSFASEVVTFADVDFTSAVNFGLGTTINLVTDTDTDGIPDYFESSYGTNHNDGDDPVSGGAGGTDTDDATGTSGDGISDALESILIANGSSSPVTVFSDTDGDGIPDYIEVANGSGPYDADSPTASGNSDTDSDGLPDALEILIDNEGGPANPALTTDTDSDGIPDYYEVINGTNPNDVNDPFLDGGSDDDGNVDGDGISDALEQILEDGGAGSPLSATTDSDGDGIPDHVEAQTFTDPFNSASPTAGVSIVRALQADYEASGGQCVDLSGYQWVDVTDQLGNLVFSINPFGNNLGTTCWGVRVLSGSGNVRDDGGSIYYLNRNWYIEPTTQPATNVYVRLYALDQEATDLASAVNAGEGSTLTATDVLNGMVILKVNGDTELDPLVTGGGSSDESPTVVDFSAATADAFVLELSSFSTLDPHVDASSPLPIELISFGAENSKEGVTLRWRTATEINNDFFTLERSFDGENFSSLTDIEGAGNSSEVRSYKYLDNGVQDGIYFYRLKQTDFDGQFSYSEVVAIYFSGDVVGDQLLVYPNPVNDNNFFISTESLEHGINFEVSILDLGGRVMKSQLLERAFNNVLSIDVSDLINGVYVVRIKSEKRTLESRIVIDK